MSENYPIGTLMLDQYQLQLPNCHHRIYSALLPQLPPNRSECNITWQVFLHIRKMHHSDQMYVLFLPPHHDGTPLELLLQSAL